MTLAEIERCAGIGHKGIVFTQDPAYFGLPQLTDRHWDPMWRSAEEKGLPVNFHIASGDLDPFNVGHPDNGMHANYAAMGVSFFMANAKTIAQLITGGICHRFPDLELRVGGERHRLDPVRPRGARLAVAELRRAGKEHPEYDLLPSEYFRRQIYGCFWFERDTALTAIEQLGADNVLYETDFPHPTSMSPGPASIAERPDDFVRAVFADLPLDDDAQDPPRQRRPHLPPRLTRTDEIHREHRGRDRTRRTSAPRSLAVRPRRRCRGAVAPRRIAVRHVWRGDVPRPGVVPALHRRGRVGPPARRPRHRVGVDGAALHAPRRRTSEPTDRSRRSVSATSTWPAR